MKLFHKWFLSLKEQLRRKLCPCNFVLFNSQHKSVWETLWFAINLFLIKSYPSWKKIHRNIKIIILSFKNLLYWNASLPSVVMPPPSDKSKGGKGDNGNDYVSYPTQMFWLPYSAGCFKTHCFSVECIRNLQNFIISNSY